MILDWLLVLGGLALLLAGGEALVRGASGLALLARIAPAVTGLTVVAAGTSMPELVVSVRSAMTGSPGIALGNLVGSNIFNIAGILGLTALLRPLAIRGGTVGLEWPVMMLATAQFHLLARDGSLDRLEGGFLLAALVVFTVHVVRLGRKNAGAGDGAADDDLVTASFGRAGRTAAALNLGAVGVGILLLAGGAAVLVRGAVGVAGALGVSDTVIGLTVVAAGTSAPELVTSLVAAWRGRADIAVGNVVGSNIFNLLGIAGLTATIEPLPVPAAIVSRDNWWMIGFSLLLLVLMKTGMRIDRVEGALLLLGLLVYLTLLVLGA